MNASSETIHSSKKQQLIGVVVSAKMLKTVVVKIDRQKRHPKYHKAFTVSKKLKAHVESGEYKPGDKVLIEAIKPISKEKRFKVISKV